ncbi:MAG TPA: ammonia channel protein [Syntrophomonas sp.]|jgi:Amt family ammonium transporter|nr:ammonia channel protein [Syntrophomonas sp.]
MNLWKRYGLLLVVTLVLTAGIPISAGAAETAAVDSGDTSFIFICAGLVMIMTPGLALFYGGMVRRKNVLSILMQCFTVMALVSVQWVLLGYTLAFGPDTGGIIGNLHWLGLHGVGFEPNPELAATIPHQLFVLFQMMFAIITAALITGAFAERMRFTAFIGFILLWTTLVYDPLAHWVWAPGGWLRELGALDFAGGTVVHISSGISGLVAALAIGKRITHTQEVLLPHNLPMTMIGAAILWLGWYGFNAGSALASGSLATSAFVATNTSAAAAAISWMAAEWLHHGKPTALGAASGVIAGLVAITPAAGFVTPISSIFIGLFVGPLCYCAVSMVKQRLGYDDALDAFGIHGVGGIFGALATGLLASKSVNPAGADGLLLGNPQLFVAQLVAVTATCLFAVIVTGIILKVLDHLVGLRVTEEDEEAGLDISQHGEDAYCYTDLSATAE